MKTLLTLLLLLSVSLFGASFDCAKVTTKVEKMICADTELSALDENLSKVFKEALKTTDNKDQLKKEQFTWMKERNKCQDDIDCVINNYKDRLGNFIDAYNLYEKPPIQLSPVKYQLIVNQNDDVCSPLLKLYNQDIEKVGKVDYDHHSEFNWLQWKEYVKPNPDKGGNQTQFIGGAFFDLNGDNKDEFVFGWYASIRGFFTEDYSVFDSNVSTFFRNSPKFYDNWKKSIVSFDNIGNDSPMQISSINYDLISNKLDKLPSYMVKKILKYKKFDDKRKEQFQEDKEKFTWLFVAQKNEIRFLKWRDGRVYVVFEGAQRFQDRNQFNLVGKVNQDYSFDAQCLFYKKIR